MSKLFPQLIVFFPLLPLFSPAALAESALETFEAYVAAGDRQDVSQLDQTLHSEFESTFVFKGKDEVSTISRKALMDGFRSGKFGGDPREITILNNTPSKNLHVLSAKLTGSELVFNGVFVMRRTGDQWQLADEYLIVESRG